MKKILLFGAGRSTRFFIDYYVNSNDDDVALTIVDLHIHPSLKDISNPHKTLEMNILDDSRVDELIEGSDVVVSMLPARLHLFIAKKCISFKTNMATASYLSEEMEELDGEARSAGITILNELGVDPGIDHLSAMRMLDNIRSNGGKITHFESFTGGLVAPGFDNNPWQYKFTWNPRNVVVAGQGGAVKFIHEGKYKYIPYHKVFRRTEIIELPDYGRFEGYANRDSLRYRSTYDLQDVKTMYRGTLRRPGFCRAWNLFVELGATDDSYVLEGSEDMTYREFINTFLAYHPTDSVELKLRQYLNIPQDDVDLWERLVYLDLFSDEKIGLKDATPAQILQKRLEEKWKLEPQDKDMIVMWHRCKYFLNGEEGEVHSSMVCEGEDQERTAMAKTVGLPLAMGVKRLLSGEIGQKGCLLPITPDIYNPILNELEEHGILFEERSIHSIS